MLWFLPWWVFGLGLGIIMAFNRLLGEYTKDTPPQIMTLLHVSSKLIFLVPIVIFLEWPKSWVFYLCCALCIIINWFNLNRLYVVMQRYGAGVTSRLMPLGLIITFLGWFLFDFSLFQKYLGEPVLFSILIILIFASTFFAMRLRQCQVTKEAFIFLAPVIFSGALVGILIKLAMDSSELESRIYVFSALSAIGMVILQYFTIRCAGFTHQKMKNIILTKRSFTIFLVLGISLTLYSIFKGYGMSLAANPAYITVLDKLAAVWVLLVYKIRGQKEEADVFSGLMLAACACGLIVVASLI